MVDKISGVGQTSGHAEPNKLVKLSELQKVNSKLYEYFKHQNLKDDSYIALSDIEDLKTQADLNQNGKISVKEARKLGFVGSRKEIKSLIQALDTAKEKIGKSDVYSIKKNDCETDFYQNDVRFKTETEAKDYKQTVLYTKDGKTPKESLEEKVADGKHIKTKTVYYQGNKNNTVVETDQDRTTFIYNPSDDKYLTRSIRVSKKDPDSVETVEYKDGNKTEIHNYGGKFIKDGVTQRIITLDADGKKLSETTNLDEPEKVLQEVMEEEQNAVQANTQKFRVPEGWSVSDIARAFGISRDEVLQANINADGEKAFRTSKKGVEYFLIDQEIDLPENAKLNEEYQPRPRVRAQRQGQGQAGGLSEADKRAAQEVIDSANSAIGASKHAKLTPRVGLGKPKPLPKPATPVAPQPETAPKDEVKPAQPAEETAPAQPVDDELAPSTSPQIPRDMNPPKTDATGMNYATGYYATGIPNGTAGDIYGNIYHYDAIGRLERIQDESGYISYEYNNYDNQNKVVRYTDYTGSGWVDRNAKGEVITYQKDGDAIRYGNGTALNDQYDYSAEESEWHLPDDFGPKGLKKK